jgi:calcium-dependent protein kinase
MGCSPSKSKSSIVIDSIKPLKSDLNLVHINQKKFLDEYHVEKTLGSGSYGEVRTVVHKLTGQQRAVKLFRKDIDFDNSYQKVKNEIEILKSLHHPCIIKIYEYFEDNKRVYIILEKCNGGELFDMITKNSNLNENTSAIICKQIFSAVGYMHDNYIVHRDIKPENILLEEVEDFVNIKIIDFGTSTKFMPDVALYELAGSPFYMAPEVIKKKYSKECDMWSCGVILYILLSGYPPFDGKDNSEIMKNVKAGNFSFEKSIWTHVSAQAKDLIQKLLCPSSKRLTASEALSHPWITSLGSYPKPDSNLIFSIKSNLRQFQSRNKLHDAIISFISTQIISSQETKELRLLFKSLDANGDGKLSKEELMNGFQSGLEANQDFVAGIMERVDTDKNGFIDLEEFLVAALNQKTLFSRENIKKAFDMFDLNGNGKISSTELQTVLGTGNTNSNDIWFDIVERMKKNSNYEIDFDEFCNLLFLINFCNKYINAY